MINKVKGALYGVAIADALGGPLEFLHKDKIKQEYGLVTEMIGGGWLDLIPGETTDDTAMTLCVAWGIVDDYLNPIPHIGKRFINWFDSKPKDIGVTCRSVIKKSKELNSNSLEEWLSVSNAYDKFTNGNSAGNGALMRTIYPGLFYPKDIAVNVSKDIGQMTHYSNLSCICIECYTKFISDCSHNLVDKKDLEDYMIPVRNITKSQNPNPTGFVVDSLIVVLNSIKDTNNFEDCIIDVINKGGDADTTGAICGGIVGCIYGYDSIPKRWLDVLDNNIKEQLDKLTNIVVNRRELMKD